MRTIHSVEGRFVISENDVWRPGSFATRDAAESAFDLSDEQLSTLQASCNKSDTAITQEMLDVEFLVDS